MIDPSQIKVTKHWFYEDAAYLCKVDASALALPAPSRAWRSVPKPTRGVTTTHYEMHFFRAYSWKSKDGHDYIRLAGPSDEPGWVRTLRVDGWPVEAKTALADQVFGEAQQKLLAAQT